jgi:DNA-binding NarL/FixJ family response regulator
VSPYDARILKMLADGWNCTEIAFETGQEKQAVRMAASRAYRRLGARNAASAVAIAIRTGVIK